MNEEREAFERAYSAIFKHSANYATKEDGQYKDTWVFIGRSLWTAALEWQAARQSAGATGQEPVHQERVTANHWKQLAKTNQMLAEQAQRRADRLQARLDAAPIGDNGASQPAESKRSSYCDTHCKKFCQNSVHGMCDGPPKDESERVELTPTDIRAIANSYDLDNAPRIVEFSRALLARAQAKGE